jgi:hypothetical protein
MPTRSPAGPWALLTVRTTTRLEQSAGSELSLGAHDPVVREAVLSALPDVGVEMLMGERLADACDLVRRGLRVRIYVPYSDA